MLEDRNEQIRLTKNELQRTKTQYSQAMERRGTARLQRTGLAPATSAPGAGLGSPLPHLRRDWDRDWAHPCHICTGTGLTPATSARETGLTAAISARGPGSPLPRPHGRLGSPLPYLQGDPARPCHICPRTGLTAATSAPGWPASVLWCAETAAPVRSLARSLAAAFPERVAAG